MSENNPCTQDFLDDEKREDGDNNEDDDDEKDEVGAVKLPVCATPDFSPAGFACTHMCRA